MRWRMALPLLGEEAACPLTLRSGSRCGKPMDRFGDHAFCCQCGGLSMARHAQLRGWLQAVATSAGWHALIEQ
eukprot:6775391-Lingulodinium_polyedra.AAC.1